MELSELKIIYCNRKVALQSQTNNKIELKEIYD